MKDFISLILALFAVGIQQSYAQLYNTPGSSRPLYNPQLQTRSKPFSLSMNHVDTKIKMARILPIILFII